MKVYTSIQYQMTEGGLVELSSDSFDYEGPVAETKGGGSPPPEPTPPPPPPTPIKEEVVVARKQAKEASTGTGRSRRRRGGLGSISSLLSGGYRGFLDQDKLG